MRASGNWCQAIGRGGHRHAASHERLSYFVCFRKIGASSEEPAAV